jgi:hypothetical protein
LEPQITELKEFFSNLKFFISNAFSCSPHPPNENALGRAATFMRNGIRTCFRGELKKRPDCKSPAF